MRIGLITGEYPPLQGGIGAYTDILSRQLRALGHDIFIFSTTATQSQTPEIHLTNVISRWSLRTNHLINQWANDNQLDILNLQFQTAAFGMSAWIHFLPNMTNIPFITTFHDLRFPYLFPKAGRLRNWIVQHLAKSSDAIIVTNHEDLEQVQPLRTKLIPIGSNILSSVHVDKQAIRQSIGISMNDFVVTFFGFMNHTKGVDTLLLALAKLGQTDIKLLMIGGKTGTADPSNQHYADKIETLIGDLALEEQVMWTGFVHEDKVSNYLQIADVVALPYQDGASFRRGSLMAAIQQNCAIITTIPQVPIPEFTEQNMVIVPPDDAEALAQAINKLKHHPEQRERLRENIQHIQKRFDWNVIACDTASFFEHIIEDCS